MTRTMKILAALAIVLLGSTNAQAKDCRDAAGRAAVKRATVEVGNGGVARGGINVGPGHDGVYRLDTDARRIFEGTSAWAVIVTDEVGYSSWVVVVDHARCEILSIVKTGLF